MRFAYLAMHICAGRQVGKVVGGTVGAVDGYVRNVGSQIRGWFGR